MNESLDPNRLPTATLVLGGIRSGKSAFAERLIEAAGDGLYIATAEINDDEMAERVRRHQERRGDTWTTVEAPIKLIEAIREADRPVLVDCVTLWLSNLIYAQADVAREVKALGALLIDPPRPVVVVSNEVGLGGISSNELQRSFADLQGATNQILAEAARRVVLISAGLPLVLKDTTHT